MTTGRFSQTVLDRLFEQPKVLVIVRIQALFSDEFPQALNQIEIGGVCRQKEDFYPEMSGPLKHEPTALIASIIHHHGNRGGEAKESDLLEQFAHAGRVDVAVIGHGNELVGDGMQRPQHIEALPATGSAHDHAGKTP